MRREGEGESQRERERERESFQTERKGHASAKDTHAYLEGTVSFFLKMMMLLSINLPVSRLWWDKPYQPTAPHLIAALMPGSREIKTKYTQEEVEYECDIENLVGPCSNASYRQPIQSHLQREGFKGFKALCAEQQVLRSWVHGIGFTARFGFRATLHESPN